MDNDSPASRVGRTFWTVWYYLTEAVSRFFRPEPANIIRNDLSAFPEPAGDNGPANCGHTDSDASRREVDEEQPVATVSVLASSRPVVAWGQCTTDVDVGPGEEHMQCKIQLGGGSESKASDEDESRTEIIADDAKEDKQEEKRVQKLTIPGQEELRKKDEYEEPGNTRSLRLTGDAMSKSGRNVGAEEKSERAMIQDEAMIKTSVMNEGDEKHHEDKTELKAEGSEVESCEEDVKMHREEKRVQRHKTDTSLTHEELEGTDGVSTLASDNDNKSDEGRRQAENQLLVCKDLEDNDRNFEGPPSFTSLHVVSQIASDKSGNMCEDELVAKDEDGEEKDVEKEQAAVTEEEKVNQLKDDIETVPEETRHIATGHVTCGEDLVQNATTEMHTVEFADGKQEDVTNCLEVQTKKRDDAETEGNDKIIDWISDVTITDITVDETIFDEDKVEEEMLSRETGNKEGYMEVAGATTSVTVKYEGETGQETSRELKNIPRGTCEGLVELQELNTPLCEEAQGGVPEYNNKPGQYENQTQRFLENSKEIQTQQLPEEVESKEQESLQDSGFSTGAERLLVGGHMEEEQESTDEIKNGFDSIVEEHTGILCFTDAGSPRETETPLVEAAIQELSGDSVKTGTEQSEKALEMHVGSEHQTDETAKQLQDGTEEVLVEFEIDEGLCDVKETYAAVDDRETTTAAAAEEVVGFAEENFRFLVAEVPTMTETGLFVEPVDDLNLRRDSYRTPDLLESGFIEQSAEIEPKLFQASVEIEDARNRIEQEAAKAELRNKNEKEVFMEAELPTESGPKEKTLSAECEALEAQNQLSDEAPEISSEETEAESNPKDMSVISAEKMARLVTESEGIYVEQTVSPSRRLQDVIDEEIGDSWIQTDLSQDTSGIKQHEGSDSGKQMDRKIEPLNEGQDEILSVTSEKNKEQLMEPESRFWDQSLCELGTQNSETQLMESTSTGSYQGIYDMLLDMSESANIARLSIQQPESRNILVQEVTEAEQSCQKEEESVTETGLQPNSGVTSSETGHLNQELHESQEKIDEETGSEKEIDDEITDLALKTSWKVTEEAEVESLTETSTLFRVKETKAEDEPLKMILSDSTDRIEHPDLKQSRSGSEASLDEGSVSPESGSQHETCSESEVVEHLTTDSIDHMEVDASVLDFTMQKSRIAVKNPRVRRPKDPRLLLHKPSLEPMSSSHLPVKIPGSVPLGGLGFGIKLPGLGTGFPILKKTQCQEPETKPEEKGDILKQDETQHKPKWMPPRHPGFGNPLLSELKTKLKKTTKDD